jgi:uncharacterized membrane protein
VSSNTISRVNGLIAIEKLTESCDETMMRGRHNSIPLAGLLLVRTRWRLFLSAAFGIVLLTAFELSGFRNSTSLLLGWDLGVALYLALCFRMFSVCDGECIRRQSMLQDEGRHVILVLSVIAALASLAAILIELRTFSGHPVHDPALIVIAIGTLGLSWTFIHTIFTLHYAHEYYAAHSGKGGGLDFPGNERPGYWDFAYLSFVVGMTSQVSDVCVTARNIRRTVATHGVISFVFNVTLLALTINVIGSLR